MQLVASRPWSKYLGLAFVSGSVLALQVTFTRIFSLMIWHHFTYLVIGVALLGGGAAGTFLAVRQWDHETLKRRVGALAVIFSLVSLLNLVAIRYVAIDPLRAAGLVWSLAGLVIYFTCLFATFFSGGLTVAAIFSRWVEQAHRLYFADMLGAGVATVSVLAILQLFGGPGTIAIVAVLAAVAGLLLGFEPPRRFGWAMSVLLAGELALLAALLLRPLALPVPESKELGWAIKAQGTGPEYTRWNPVGRVDVMPEIAIKEPMIVGAVSSAYPQDGRPDLPLRLVTIDGTSMTGMYQFDGSDADLQRFRFLDHAVIGAVYHLGLVLLVVAALIVVYIVALPPVFAALLRLPDSARIAASVLLMAPLSTVMGMPFPTGLRQLGERAPALVPWAWGMNGVFSVFGSVMVILVSMISSFTLALACGALCYASAAVVSAALWRVSVARAAAGKVVSQATATGGVSSD